MDRLLEGKVALVTGAAAGIGRASALAFGREGASVVVSDIDEAGGRETVDLVQESGGEAIFQPCDVSDRTQVRLLVATAVREFGGLHCAHNNAGIGHAQVPLADVDGESWNRNLGINLSGTWNCVQEELWHMAAHGGGAIVATSSSASVRNVPGTSAYAVTKAGMNAVVRAAAAEYATAGVRVNAVLPGPTETDLVARSVRANPGLDERLLKSVPMARFGRPEEVADVVVWLCSARSWYVTGALIPVEGGKTLV